MAITRTAFVDDDGSGTTGTVINNAVKTELYNQIDAALAAVTGVIQTTTSTGTVNDFALSAGAGRLYLNNAALLTLTGLAAGVDGQLLWLIAIGAGQVDLKNADAGSVAANRILNGVTGTISLAASGKALLAYDAAAARWRVLVHEQGAWIVPTFAAGDYTASGAMTWTVDAGDVGTCAYLVDAGKRQMTIALTASGTTVGGTLSSQLKRLIPGGFSAARQMDSAAQVTDNNTPLLGLAFVFGTSLIFAKPGFTNWSASTNLSDVRTIFTFELG